VTDPRERCFAPSRSRSSTPARRTRRAALCAWVAALACWAGCRGGGKVDFILLSYQSIDPPSPAVTTVELDGCYWWIDEEKRLWIAMEREIRPVLVPFAHFTFQLSLALDKPPAGPARDYEIGARELRAVVRLGPTESRFTSRRGIVAIYREGPDRLRGSLRIEASREVYAVFGWTQPSRMLILARFSAVRDPERGRLIAATTEANGWHRDDGPPAAGVTVVPFAEGALRAEGSAE
jgi:hypothetical protein